MLSSEATHSNKNCIINYHQNKLVYHIKNISIKLKEKQNPSLKEKCL